MCWAYGGRDRSFARKSPGLAGKSNRRFFGIDQPDTLSAEKFVAHTKCCYIRSCSTTIWDNRHWVLLALLFEKHQMNTTTLCVCVCVAMGSIYSFADSFAFNATAAVALLVILSHQQQASSIIIIIIIVTHTHTSHITTVQEKTDFKYAVRTHIDSHYSLLVCLPPANRHDYKTAIESNNNNNSLCLCTERSIKRKKEECCSSSEKWKTLLIFPVHLAKWFKYTFGLATFAGLAQLCHGYDVCVCLFLCVCIYYMYIHSHVCCVLYVRIFTALWHVIRIWMCSTMHVIAIYTTLWCVVCTMLQGE